MEEADLGRRSSDRPEGATINGAVGRGGGGHRRLPKAYPAAARRLPLCPAADHPASDALITASLPAAPRHLPACPRSKATSRRRRKFKAYPIGYFHIDIAEVRTAEGKLYLFVAIDRTSKFAFVELHEKATTRIAADFLRHLIEAVPYKVHTVLTDNGTHFTTPGRRRSAAPKIKAALANGRTLLGPRLRICLRQQRHRPSPDQAEASLDQRPGRADEPDHQGRDRQALPLRNHDQLRRHLADFVAAYNFARRLKTLKGLTPYEFICKRWTSRARTIHPQPAPSNAGTKHLERNPIRLHRSLRP